MLTKLLLAASVLVSKAISGGSYANTTADVLPAQPYANETRDGFVNRLVSEMTVSDMALQLHLMFADNILGPKSDNSLWDQALSPAPADTAVGVVHDWYPLNKSYYNGLQRLNLEKSRLKIPFMHVGECLHGVGSFKQSMFPQTVALAATFDQDLVHRVGHAIGSEARSIGVHACFSPVLDVCQDQRWGRCQEDWGEDHVFTSHMGVSYASGMSKNSTWSASDAVAPVMKHFAAHGSPQSGHNAAPFMGHGNRQVLQNLLMPFKAAVDLGGVKGVMMAYNELDDVPSSVNPMLYDALNDWGFDGYITADDTGLSELQYTHMVSATPADTIAQWLNAGGMVNYYDYPLATFLNSTVDLVKNGTVARSTLEAKMKRILGLKYDLGLFHDPYIAEDVDPNALTISHTPLTLEAAQKGIVLLENRNSTLPLAVNGEGKTLALIGPFGDILNYGDYSGQFGAYPVARSSTIRHGILSVLDEKNCSTKLVSGTGANTWVYNAQYPIPGYHLSANGTTGGLQATYYADTNFSQPLVRSFEVPVGDWGLYPPPGLPHNNFSVVWEGDLIVPVEIETDGWLGVAVSPNTTASLYVDGQLLSNVPSTTAGNILSNIPPRTYNLVNSTAPPPGSGNFIFQPGAKHHIRLEYQAYNLYQKLQNQNSLNAEILLFWNLVDKTSPVEKAVSVAKNADNIILALGGNWNSDGEGGDRGTMDLSANQTELADAIYALGKPVILVLQGGRPFAIPDYYNASAAVLQAWFPGQSGGEAIVDVLFGKVNPGGRLPVTIPKNEGQMPVYYNQKASSLNQVYIDIDSSPAYSFGYGLSYTNFTLGQLTASISDSNKTSNSTFGPTSTITFSLRVQNNGGVAGSYVPQVYLLQRVSTISQPVKQLVAFTRVYLDAGASTIATMELEVDRYLKILNRKYEWEVEAGDYVFALQESGSAFADTANNVTLTRV